MFPSTTDGLKLQLRQSGASGNIYTWSNQYLHNRQARVQLQREKSKKKLIRQGVPQGGVLSPTFFLVFIDDIVEIYQDESEEQSMQTTWCFGALKSIPPSLRYAPRQHLTRSKPGRKNDSSLSTRPKRTTPSSVCQEAGCEADCLRTPYLPTLELPSTADSHGENR